MRGELDDALARLERWDEVRRQLTDEAASGAPALIDEVVRAVSAVLQRRGSGAVTLTVAENGSATSAEITYRDGRVAVSTPVETPAGAARPSRSAARLAELIRQDPTLLDGLRAGDEPPAR